jgi:hypothetical protein
MIWFGTLLPNSLRAYGIRVSNDDPFDTSWTIGIDSDHAFIPFDTTGTVVHLESRVPTEWKKTTGTVVHLESRVPAEWKARRCTYLSYLRARIGIHLKKCCVMGTKAANSRKCLDDTFPYISGMTRRQFNSSRGDEAQLSAVRST